jgi:hypothetical protein
MSKVKGRLATSHYAVGSSRRHEVSREAHELALRHGRVAHIFAASLADKAESADDFKAAQFWRAVSRSLTPRAWTNQMDVRFGARYRWLPMPTKGRIGAIAVGPGSATNRPSTYRREWLASAKST